MRWVWARPGEHPRSAPFATEQEARDNAVFNAMIKDARTKVGQSGSARYKRMSDDQKALIWRSLERAGWRIEIAP